MKQKTNKKKASRKHTDVSYARNDATLSSDTAASKTANFRKSPAIASRYHRNIWPLVGLASLFTLTRCVNLTLPGMAYDETTYLAWGLAINANPSVNLYIGSYQGKPPLHSWLIAISQQFINDPVLAGRYVSVIAGALTTLAVYLVARRLFSQRTAILAALLYILLPYTLSFDRLALTDSLLSMSALWMLYFSIRLLQSLEWASVIGLSLAFFVGLMTKPVSQFFPIFILPLVLCLPRDRRFKERLTKWATGFGIGVIGGWLLYLAVFGLRPEAAIIAQFEKNYGKYTISFLDLFTFPWELWLRNGSFAVDWLWNGLTPFFFVVGAISLMASYWLGCPARVLALWVAAVILGQVALASVFYDRHILFAMPQLIILIACLLDWTAGFVQRSRFCFWRSSDRLSTLYIAVSAVLIIGFSPALLHDWQLITDSDFANRQVDGFGGLNRTRDYLAQNSETTPIYVVVNQMAGVVTDGLTVLMARDLRFKILRVVQQDGKWVIFDFDTRQIYPKEFFAGKTVYYSVFDGDSEFFWLAQNAQKETTFDNASGNNASTALYRIRLDDSFR